MVWCYLQASIQGSILSNKIISWVKNEKTKIESDFSVFEKSYWIDKIKKLKMWYISKKTEKFNGQDI